MAEFPTAHESVFPGLSSEKAQILANNIYCIETTLGDNLACRICMLQTPIGVQKIMPTKTIQAIHKFILNHSSDREPKKVINYHHRGQISDYHDPSTGWDMADVIIDALTMKNPVGYLTTFEPVNTTLQSIEIIL